MATTLPLYIPTKAPTLPGSDRKYLNNELKKISEVINELAAQVQKIKDELTP